MTLPAFGILFQRQKYPWTYAESSPAVVGDIFVDGAISTPKHIKSRSKLRTSFSGTADTRVSGKRQFRDKMLIYG
jgi:hypothetical protein